MRRATTVGLVALILAAVIAPAGIAGVATASHDSTNTTESSDTGVGVTEMAAAAGDRAAWEVSQATENARAVLSSIFGGESSSETTNDAVQHADNLQSEFNQNNSTLEPYVNNRFGGDASEWNVIRVKMHMDGDTATRYIVADVDSTGNFSNASMVADTNRTVDKTLETSGFATARADEELAMFVDEFASSGKDINHGLKRSIAVKYLGDVTLPAGISP